MFIKKMSSLYCSSNYHHYQNVTTSMKMRSLILFILIFWLLHHLRVINAAATTESSYPRTALSSSFLPSNFPSSTPSSGTGDYREEYGEEEGEEYDDDEDEDYDEEVGTASPSAPNSSDLETHESNRVIDRQRQRPLHPAWSLRVNGDANEFEDDFCSAGYVDSAYFNGYDWILTRGDRLWYYYKDRHQLSRAFDQRRFTQGDHIQGAFNISRTPYYCLNQRRARYSDPSGKRSTTIQKIIPKKRRQTESSSPATDGADCLELQKLRSMAVYFLHNKERTRSYYNLDVRHPNGTQRRVRSRDLPWNMKQVGLLGGNLWPNGWETYQQYRPVAYLPSRYEVIFILNDNHRHHGGRHHPNRSPLESIAPSPILTWNNLDASNWNTSWRSKVLHYDPPVMFTGMFEMNGIVYAIGERDQPQHTNKPFQKRIARMFRYQVTENDGRDFVEMNQTVREFFGCPRFTKDEIQTTTPISTTALTSSTGRIETSTRLPSTDTITTSNQRSSPSSTNISTSKITTTTTSTTIRPNKLKVVNNTTTSTTTSRVPTTTRITTTTTTTTVKPEKKNSSEEDGNQSNNEIEHSTAFPAISKKKSEQSLFISPSNTETPQPPSVFLRNSRAKITSVQNPKQLNVPSSGPHVHHSTNTNQIALAGVAGSTAAGSYPKLIQNYPTVTLRETDSIMLTILIAIVIGASVLCIVLACLVINGKKRQVQPHFESGHRIEPTLPKPNIIGLDYHRRKNSTSSSLTPFNFLNRYDSMNSLTAIYSHVSTTPHRVALSRNTNTPDNPYHHGSYRISASTTPTLSVVDERAATTASPNLHALHPPVPPVRPPPTVISTKNKSPQSSVQHKSSISTHQPQLCNKAISVNLTGKRTASDGVESVPPNLLQVQVTTSSSSCSSTSSTASSTGAEANKSQASSAVSVHNRIKSFERFENLI